MYDCSCYIDPNCDNNVENIWWFNMAEPMSHIELNIQTNKYKRLNNYEFIIDNMLHMRPLYISHPPTHRCTQSPASIVSYLHYEQHHYAHLAALKIWVIVLFTHLRFTTVFSGVATSDVLSGDEHSALGCGPSMVVDSSLMLSSCSGCGFDLRFLIRCDNPIGVR